MVETQYHYRKTLEVLSHKEGVSYLFYGCQVLDKMRDHHMALQSQLCMGTTIWATIWVVPLLSSQFLISWFCTHFLPTFTTLFLTNWWKTETRQTGTRGPLLWALRPSSTPLPYNHVILQLKYLFFTLWFPNLTLIVVRICLRPSTTAYHLDFNCRTLTSHNKDQQPTKGPEPFFLKPHNRFIARVATMHYHKPLWFYFFGLYKVQGKYSNGAWKL